MAETRAISTQDLIDIAALEDDIIVLKRGGIRQILIVSGINFDLKSEDEQSTILSSYRNLLNSLDFSLQFIVHSRKLNIGSYLRTLDELALKEENELLRNQILEYQAFIREFVEQNAIMAKTFFVVIPYERIVLPSKAGMLSFLPFGKKKNEPKQPQTDEELTHDIRQLRQRTEQTIAGLQAIGLRAVPLNGEEVIELFYNFYNPEAVEKKGLSITQDHSSPSSP
ncbi:MAG: hypothetical protein Q8Q41_01835 [bacterium]|nr:hypothetical protein [bacterium]